jgi:drug/metabolite transporter (DMT)-like permease
MSIVQLLLILLAVLLLSVGQIMFKLTAESIDVSPSGLIPSLMTIRFITALFVYVIATGLWLIALKGVPLRMAYPFAAMAFFIVPTLAHFILGEKLGWNTYAGAAIIAIGVVLSVAR